MILAAMVAVSAAPVAAHEWYDPSCCSGQDCAPVEASAIKAEDGNWHVSLDPGSHPLVTKPMSWVVPFDAPKVRESQDDKFHACVGVRSGILFCLYVPQGGF